MKKIITILFIFSLFLVACKETAQPQEPAPQPPPTEVSPETPLTEDVEAGIDEIDDLDTELDIGDLEDLDKELDQIDW